MPELLLEVGTEELPATAVHRAFTELAGKIAVALTEARVISSDSQPVSLGTPRRLIVSFPEVAPRQENSSQELRGPGVKAAFDAEGKPTQALLGFCRGQGLDPSQVREDGQYVWVTKQIVGRPTLELLQEILPKAIRSLTFDKTMRWGTSRMRFARPIRWLLASFGGQLIPFDIEGVESSLKSFGHRFYAPESFEAGSFSQLTKELRARHVEPDPAIRRERIETEAKAVAKGKPDLPAPLVDENVYLCEWPIPIAGHFHPEFQELPEQVLVTAMAKHEKMFPIRDDQGNLTNQFVFVRNSGETDAVRSGCEWVLNARFNDAKFFFDEDKRRSLGDFLDKTKGIVFQEKLGTVDARAHRLQRLARNIAEATNADTDESNWAAQAGLYAKADLSTGLVSELASLQGIVGGEYAKREGFPEAVWKAIADQYDLSKNPNPNNPTSRTAVRLVMADQLDKLAGYLGIGLEPSGSSDPFALRRAASLLIEASWNWLGPVPPYSELFEIALDGYAAQDVPLDRIAAHEALDGLFASRYSTLMPGVRYDILEAALLTSQGPEATDARAIRFRARILETLAEDVPFVQTATRPLNIVMAARKKGIEFGTFNPFKLVEHSALESAEGLDLLEIAEEQAETLANASAEEKDEDVLQALRRLQAPINAFFDTTMVMADQPEVRFARLTLLHGVSQQLLVAGDFSKLVIEG